VSSDVPQANDDVSGKRGPGRPRRDPNATADDIFEEARQYAASLTKMKKCFDTLFEVTQSPKASPKDRSFAAVNYLNFTMGKAAQQEPTKKNEKPVLNIGLPQVGAEVPVPSLTQEESVVDYSEPEA
jgi:hypothetical protein